MKRLRKPKIEPGQLVIYWGRCERGDAPSLVYHAGGDGADKRDGMALAQIFEMPVFNHPHPLLGDNKLFEGRTLAQELERRGYDLTTLRFSIKQKEK